MWLTSYENTMSFTNANEKKEKKKDFKRLEVLSLAVV